MTTPHYIIIGTMKSGTSTLAAQLGAQPGLFMTEPKEPQFFSDDPVYARGPDWYASLFEGLHPEVYVAKPAPITPSCRPIPTQSPA